MPASYVSPQILSMERRICSFKAFLLTSWNVFIRSDRTPYVAPILWSTASVIFGMSLNNIAFLNVSSYYIYMIAFLFVLVTRGISDANFLLTIKNILEKV